MCVTFPVDGCFLHKKIRFELFFLTKILPWLSPCFLCQPDVDVRCLIGESRFQRLLQPDLHSAFHQLSLHSPDTAATTEPSPDLTARWQEALLEKRMLALDKLHKKTLFWLKSSFRNPTLNVLLLRSKHGALMTLPFSKCERRWN